MWIIAIIILTVARIYPVYAGELEELRKTLEESVEPAKKAYLYKKIGDYYISTDDIKKASEAYINALSLKRDAFSIDERLQMAIRISWAGRLRESLLELKYILSEEPENLKARIHYARVLSWSGRLDDALREINIVLEKEPENRDALVIKANSLRWKGRQGEAMEIYNKLLKDIDDFDARLGLVYSLIATGDIASAEENIKLLKPTYPYQEKELSELRSYLKGVKGPQIRTDYSYYSDSDDNVVSRYSGAINIVEGLWKFSINYRLTHGEDNLYKNNAHALSVTGSRRLGNITLTGSGGITYLDNENPSTVFTGALSTEVEMPGVTVSLNAERGVLTDTALLIERRIRFTGAGMGVSASLSDSASLEGLYRFRDYSDNNQSHDLQAAWRYYVIRGNPTISTGYRIRYLDFKKQTANGYFDPNGFLSHHVFVSLYLERNKVYLFAEPYGGYQSFRRYGKRTHDFFTGGSMTVGYRTEGNLSIEIKAEGGDYAAGTATGFRYFMAGVSLKVVF